MPFSLNADKFLESSLGLDQFGIGQLRSVEWGRKYLWSFNFLKLDENIQGLQIPPKPFDKFFPCVDIDENESTIEVFNGEAYGTAFQVPLKGAVSTVRVTFIDDNNHTLYNFFNNWMKNDILNGGRYITPLEEAVKAIEIRRVKLSSLSDYANEIGSLVGLTESSDNGISATSKYWVFPTGDLVYNGGSTSDTQMYSVNLVVAGAVNSETADGGLGNTLQNVVRSLGGTAILGGVGRLLG
jgi:hypothetical protein